MEFLVRHETCLGEESQPKQSFVNVTGGGVSPTYVYVLLMEELYGHHDSKIHPDCSQWISSNPAFWAPPKRKTCLLPRLHLQFWRHYHDVHWNFLNENGKTKKHFKKSQSWGHLHPCKLTQQWKMPPFFPGKYHQKLVDFPAMWPPIPKCTWFQAPVAGTVKKTHRFRPGTLALRSLAWQQTTTSKPKMDGW